MSSFPYKRIMHNSNPKNKINIVKNITGMNDPAFKSNKTLKKYINEKLNSYLESNISPISKAKSFSKFNEKKNNQIYINKRKISFNMPLREHSIILHNINSNNSSPKINSSSYSFNTKINNDKKSRFNKMVKKPRSKSFIFFKHNNKNKFSINQNQYNKNKEYTLYFNKNEIHNLTEYNNTPNNMIKKIHKTTPINELNKKRCIYYKKQISFNESLGLENIKQKLSNNLVKEKEKNSFINQKLNSINNNKSTLNKNSNRQIKLIKDEIENKTINKLSNNNIMQLNQSFFREDSKISQINNNKIIIRKKNYSMHNKMANKEAKNLKNCVCLLKDTINSLLQNDECLNESECPVPMPYVRKYSENSIIKSENKENANLGNILFNKDLKEPKERKKAPLPISQPIIPNYFIKNKFKNKKIYFYSNSNKINGLKIKNIRK